MSGDDTVRKAAGAAKSAAGDAQQAGREVAGSKWFRMLVSVGLVAYGIVHILIGWLALQIALAGFGTGGGGEEEASQQGALAEIAEQPFGAVLLWAIVVGLFAMAAWQLMEAGWGHLDRPAGFKRIRKRISSAGRAVAYIVLGIAAFGAAQGSPETGDSNEEGLTAQLLAAPFGRILVIALGVGVLALGVRNAVRGITRKFTRDLEGSVSRKVEILGQVGYIAKGVAFGVVGALFVWAAVGYDPERAGGLDDALRTINEAPFGPVLLALVAVGLIAFGVYCFAWARRPKVTADQGASGSASARSR